jgi:predicted RNA-binding Zn ribbon-like protein
MKRHAQRFAPNLHGLFCLSKAERAWAEFTSGALNLATSEALLDWFGIVRLVTPRYSARLQAHWRKHPDEAERFYKEAIVLREAVYQLFRARLAAQRYSESHVKLLNATLRASAPGLRVASVRSLLVWSPAFAHTSPADLLKPIAWSAADLLTGPRAQKIRQCQDDRGCGWLFIDESRAQNRRWCSMGDCGNRAKARRHYIRHKSTENDRSTN